MINEHIQKFSARAFGARIIFFNTLYSKFAVFHIDLLFEIYTGVHLMIIKIFNHTYTYVLIFDCLSGQGKMEISQGSQGKVREFRFLVWVATMISCYIEIIT